MRGMRRAVLWAWMVAALCVPGGAAAGGRWEPHVDGFARQVAERCRGADAFVGEFVEAGGEGRVYAFVDAVRQRFVAALGGAGRVVADPALADAYVTVTYRIGPDGLGLEARVRSLEGGRVLGGASALIPGDVLPPGWDRRTLREVARELAAKLQDTLVGQRLRMAVELSDPRPEDPATAGLHETLRGYLVERLTAADGIEVVGQAGPGDVRLALGFRAEGDDAVAEATVRRAGSAEVLATATARFPADLLRPEAYGPPSFVLLWSGEGAEVIGRALKARLTEAGAVVHDAAALTGLEPGAGQKAVLAAAAAVPARYVVSVHTETVPAGGMGAIKAFRSTALVEATEVASGEVTVAVEQSERIFGLTREQALTGRGRNHFGGRVAEPAVERFMERAQALLEPR
ncbi:hypothetical protein [Deferrisoma sp.]